ncbi:MAG: ORF6N domain-containing protein [Chitinophagaceae bacterium]
MAALYEVETKVLNQAVKRNNKRFPGDFMFQLTNEEFQYLKSEIMTSNSALKIKTISNKNPIPLRSQNVTLKEGRGQHSKYLPFAFTEQGIAMLSGILSSDIAIAMNISIMRAFVEIRSIVLQQGDIKEQLRQIQERITGHDIQLSSIYEAIENLLDDKAAQRKWEDRERIGF